MIVVELLGGGREVGQNLNGADGVMELVARGRRGKRRGRKEEKR